MKRIVILSYDYPPNNGGIARLCGGIVNELKCNNIPYLVVTNVKDEGETNDNIVRVTGKRGLVEWKISKFLIQNTTSNDIVVCDTWHPAGILSILCNRNTYILAHGAELLPGVGFYRKYIRPLYRTWVLRHSNGIIANSHYTERLVNSVANGLNTIAIPLPMDSTVFEPTQEKNCKDDILRICSISRLERFKGHDFILKTISTLPSHYRKRIRFEIGGKGPYLETLKRLCYELGLEEIVSFKGFVSEGELCDFYSRNDLFILCTREEPNERNVEGFGLVFIEAQACGTAVIGTKTGGITDAVSHEHGGWLIKQDSIEDLSSLLKNLIDNKKYVQDQGEVARQRVEKEYKWADYMSSILTFVKWYI